MDSFEKLTYGIFKDFSLQPLTEHRTSEIKLYLKNQFSELLTTIDYKASNMILTLNFFKLNQNLLAKIVPNVLIIL